MHFTVWWPQHSSYEFSLFTEQRKCDLLFGLLKFMSLLAFGSLKHLNKKDNSYHKNERNIPSMFLSFVFEVLILLYIVIKHAARTPLPWWVWDRWDNDGSLLKAQAHFSVRHYYQPCCLGQCHNCCPVPPASVKRLWARDWHQSAGTGRLQHFPGC